MKVLLKAATVVDAQNLDIHLKKRDILIVDGVISKIASKIEASEEMEVISKKNLHVSQGWLDTSVSFGEPGFEERETIENGLLVAAKSGFTAVVLNPTSHPIPDSSSDIVFLKSSAAAYATDVYPLGTLTVKGEGTDLSEIFDMKNSGAVGFSDHKHPIANSNLLKIALQYTQSFKGLVYSFPIDEKIAGKGVVNEGITSTRLGLKGIPSLAEELQVARDLFILEYTGGSLHIPTISTAKSVALIAEAKKKGLDVSCSVALHNLWFTDESLEEFDTHFKVMPPLRSKQDIKALLKGVNTGVIDFVTTDHSPLDIEQKKVEFDNAAYGTIGLENAFGILNELFGVEKAVALLTQHKDRYSIPTTSIKEGEKACLTLFNPEEAYTASIDQLASTSKNSIYLHQKLKGKALGIVNGSGIII